MRITKILLLLMTVIVLSGIASASIVAFDGKTISICNDKGKVCSTLRRYSNVNAVELNQGTLYVAKYNMVKIINVKDPSQPSTITNFKPGFKCLTTKNNILFGGNSEGIYIYDITNRYRPKLLATIKTKSPVNYMTINLNTLYVKMDKGTATYGIRSYLK